MVWLLATYQDGTTLEYGIPLSEKFLGILHDPYDGDVLKFRSLEVLDVDYSVNL